MISLVAGLGAAFAIWWVLKNFAKASPAKVAKLLRQVGGVAALAGAGLMGVKGRLDMAFLLGGAGAWLLGWQALPAFLGGPRAAAARPGMASRVRSATIEMRLDHDTGAIDGRVIAGPQAGRELAAMSQPELLALHRDAVRSDSDGARLLEAYLDRRLAGWREHAEADPDARRRADPKGAAMAEEEAYQILGLQPGADAAAISRAHRTLMKKLHPDQGGSTYLASRVNQAKDVLLGRHR